MLGRTDEQALRGKSRSVRSRALRRAAQEEWANDGVATLNELYCRRPADDEELAQRRDIPTPAQRA